VALPEQLLQVTHQQLSHLNPEVHFPVLSWLRSKKIENRSKHSEQDYPKRNNPKTPKYQTYTSLSALQTSVYK